MLPAWRKLWPAVMAGEGASDEFVGFNIRNKDTVHEMESMFEKRNPSNPEREASQVDVEVWTDVGDGDVVNVIMSPDSGRKILGNESSIEQIATGNIYWVKAAKAYSTLLKFANSRPCYWAQEVMQVHILYSPFMPNRKKAPRNQTFARRSRQPESPARISGLTQSKGSNESGWSVRIHEESSGIGW
jgi:hypothetical protein